MGALTLGMVLDGRYELVEQLGRGGMASVYRARDRRLDRPVALKVLHEAHQDEAGAAFREDQVTAQLAHPHIVGVYDSGTTPDGRPFLVMELIDGEPIDRLAPPTIERALEIAEEVAAAVAHAHERGIVHCDIKPQNVLLDALGQAKLTDFGVASADKSPVGEVVYGSASYIAPERLRGAPTSPAVDIYALGGLLYFLISGRPPYTGTSGAEIIAQVTAGPPPPLTSLVPAVPPAVDAIVRRAMAPAPADRYPSAAALRQAIVDVRRAAGEHTRGFGVTPAAAADTAVLPAVPATTPTSGSPSGSGAAPADPRAVAVPRGRPHWLLPVLAALFLVLLLGGLGRTISGLRGGAEVGETVPVPALEGLTLGEARRRLLDSGLAPGRVDTVPLPGKPGVVVYQDPPANERVRPGTTVDFALRTASPNR